MKCLETRRRKGLKWRRYRTEGGARVVTYEVPESVLGYISEERLQSMIRAHEADIKRQEQQVKARKLLAEGWKASAIAHELGISEKVMSTIRRKIESEDQRTRSRLRKAPQSGGADS